MLRRRARSSTSTPTSMTPVAITIGVIDDQRDVAVDTSRYHQLMSDVLVAEGVTGPGEATLLFVDRDTIAQLNRLHLGGEGSTDVLSFPIDAGEEMSGVESRMVGDVVVCPAVAAHGAAAHAGDVDGEIALLVVHGTLHLLGHDHDDPADRAAMWARERALMAAHWGELSRDPWA